MAAQIIYNNVKAFAQLALANTNIMAGVASVTNGDGDIADLLVGGTKTQTVLGALKTLIDNMVARKMLKIVIGASAGGSVTIQFYVNYNSSLTAQTSLVLYAIEMSNFFAADGSGDYTVKANAALYPSPDYDNALYIGNVTTLQNNLQELITLINTIQNA